MKLSRVVLLGKFGPPFLAFARSCGRRGIDVHSLEVRTGSEPWSPQTSFLSGGAIVHPSLLFTPAGLAFVKEYIARLKADALIAMGDQLVVWLSANREELQSVCKVMAPEEGVLLRLLSKRYQMELAEKVGFDILPSWSIFGRQDLSQIPSDAYPICVRPATEHCAKPTFKAKVLHDSAAAGNFFSGIEISGEPVIAQPFCSVPNLTVHATRSESGEILAVEGFLVYRKFEGVGLSIRRTSLDPVLRDRCMQFAHEAGVTGPFHYDFLYSETERKAYYLEINVRLGGTTEKVLRLGYDEPALALKAYGFDVRIDAENTNGSSSVVNKRALVKHIIAASKGKLTELDYPEGGRLKNIAYSLWEMVSVKDSVFDWGDLQGSFWFHLRGPR